MIDSSQQNNVDPQSVKERSDILGINNADTWEVTKSQLAQKAAETPVSESMQTRIEAARILASKAITQGFSQNNQATLIDKAKTLAEIRRYKDVLVKAFRNCKEKGNKSTDQYFLPLHLVHQLKTALTWFEKEHYEKKDKFENFKSQIEIALSEAEIFYRAAIILDKIKNHLLIDNQYDLKLKPGDTLPELAQIAIKNFVVQNDSIRPIKLQIEDSINKLVEALYQEKRYAFDYFSPQTLGERIYNDIEPFHKGSLSEVLGFELHTIALLAAFEAARSKTDNVLDCQMELMLSEVDRHLPKYMRPSYNEPANLALVQHTQVKTTMRVNASVPPPSPSHPDMTSNVKIDATFNIKVTSPGSVSPTLPESSINTDTEKVLNKASKILRDDIPAPPPPPNFKISQTPVVGKRKMSKSPENPHPQSVTSAFTIDTEVLADQRAGLTAVKTKMRTEITSNRPSLDVSKSILLGALEKLNKVSKEEVSESKAQPTAVQYETIEEAQKAFLASEKKAEKHLKTRHVRDENNLPLSVPVFNFGQIDFSAATQLFKMKRKARKEAEKVKEKEEKRQKELAQKAREKADIDAKKQTQDNIAAFSELRSGTNGAYDSVQEELLAQLASRKVQYDSEAIRLAGEVSFDEQVDALLRKQRLFNGYGSSDDESDWEYDSDLNPDNSDQKTSDDLTPKFSRLQI